MHNEFPRGSTDALEFKCTGPFTAQGHKERLRVTAPSENRNINMFHNVECLNTPSRIRKYYCGLLRRCIDSLCCMHLSFDRFSQS